jgi:hypothetical protein
LAIGAGAAAALPGGLRSKRRAAGAVADAIRRLIRLSRFAGRRCNSMQRHVPLRLHFLLLDASHE